MASEKKEQGKSQRLHSSETSVRRDSWQELHRDIHFLKNYPQNGVGEHSFPSRGITNKESQVHCEQGHIQPQGSGGDG